MFTGIIESLGVVRNATTTGTNKTFWIESAISRELRVDQSVTHNGVCLTVEEIKDDCHRVTAIAETLAKSNLENWKPGGLVNLERSLQIGSRLDGHLVQGHVDTTATCISKKENNGSWEFSFSFSKIFSALIIEKGSVSINGISLTAFNVKKKSFSVAIIPYTYQQTNMKALDKGTVVNIEFDMIGKYVLRKLSLEE